MLNKAVDSDLLHKNVAKQINTVVSKDSKPEEPRVLTIEETDLFLEAASHYRYFNVFSLALETGMRIGEIIGLKWSDIDFNNGIININKSSQYLSQKGVFTKSPKTESSSSAPLITKKKMKRGAVHLSARSIRSKESLSVLQKTVPSIMQTRSDEKAT